MVIGTGKGWEGSKINDGLLKNVFGAYNYTIDKICMYNAIKRKQETVCWFSQKIRKKVYDKNKKYLSCTW